MYVKSFDTKLEIRTVIDLVAAFLLSNNRSYRILLPCSSFELSFLNVILFQDFCLAAIFMIRRTISSVLWGRGCIFFITRYNITTLHQRFDLSDFLAKRPVFKCYNSGWGYRNYFVDVLPEHTNKSRVYAYSYSPCNVWMTY